MKLSIRRAYVLALVVLAGTLAMGMIPQWQIGHAQTPAPMVCAGLIVTDGDSLRCSDQRIRLLGIDAPEMPGSCRPGRECVQGDPYAARDYLVSLTRTTVRCTPEGQDRYGRTLARCTANGVDLSCAMIRSGHAVRRYAHIRCR